jgi:HCOMODA/2-hydroxy-3-carboxy-muconic semialdehyde decarboxylase
MAEASDSFAAALRVMDGMGLTEAFGHLSERVADNHDVIRITPAMGPGLANSHQCILFDLAGRRLPGNESLPAPLETPMHLAIYNARPDVNAICRTHSPYAVSVGAVAGSVPCLHGFSLMLGRDVPVHMDIDLIHSVEQAQALARTLGSGGACLIRGNGALAVGRDISHAIVHAIYLEQACRIYAQVGAAAGAAARARVGNAEFCARNRWHENEVVRAWAYYCSKYACNRP